MSFNRKRKVFYVTKKENLLNIVILFIISAIEITIFIRQILILESNTNTLFLDIMSIPENSFHLFVAYVNFYLYKTMCITIFQKIYKFDKEANYIPSSNYRMRPYKIFSVLTFIVYLSIDILCLFNKIFPLEYIYIVICYISIFVNFAGRFIFIFLVTEIENRFIFVGSSKNPKLYKHIKTLTEISKHVNNIYSCPLILNAAKICMSLTISLSYTFFLLNEKKSNYVISIVITTVWFFLNTCEIGVILLYCQNFYKTVSSYYHS